MIRLSATNIEAYRRWSANPDTEVNELVDYLLKRTEPTEAMEAGSAFHKVLENSAQGELTTVESGRFLFDFTEMDGELALPDIRERKLEKPFVVDGEPVTFVGVVDAMDTTTIYDHKLTAQLNPENYTDSMQWRCYLDWFGLSRFTYNLFHKYQPAREPGLYKIKEFMPVTFYSYPDIHSDVMNVASGLVQFIKQYVPELIKEVEHGEQRR
ncbi:MAG: hypothetical protein LBI71_10155 [Enterobacteriaceae bacterium]|jgi:hypothetical protein|nr:hypothetical protein [Enterobacteriaceae bacterium]